MRILIFSASTGGGHKRAAAALEAKIKSLGEGDEVFVVDALKAIGHMYDKTVCGGYHFMATKTPKFYGKCYRLTDKKSTMYKAVMKTNTMKSNKLLKVINLFNPDIIITCHPFLTTMISRLRRKGKLDITTISLITDYAAHRTYVVPYIDAFVLAEPQMSRKVIEEYGTDKSIIYPIGIPILDRFSQEFDKEAICQREGLDPDKKTVLLMAGSFGVTGVLDFYKRLASDTDDIQLIVITGNNKKLYTHFEELIEKLGTADKTVLKFFVDNVEDYMHISDVIITKPGGLTVTESLACRLPLAIYSAFPGQEFDNAEFLAEQQAAILLGKHDPAGQIIELLGDTQRLEYMKKRCEKLSNPNAAEDIYRLAKRLLAEKNN